MKGNFTLIPVTAIVLLFLPNTNFGQAPNLGAAANFVLFSTVGAIGNTGITQLTGNVGTNSGAISGFGNVNGVMHNADAVTAQAAIDLQAAWHYLATLPPTSIHAPVLGNGETLYAGVDTIAAAGSVVGVLTLDAQGDSSAVFIIKSGGALTTAANATVNLVNGALACNVFWVAEGAISMATLTVMRGTLIAHNGAIDMGDGGTIEGRALAIPGAVSVYGTHAYMPVGCGSPVLTGPSAPNLGTAACFSLFSSSGVVSNTGITHVTGDVGTNYDSTKGFNPLFVAGSLRVTPDFSTAQCAVDLQNVYTYLSALPYDIELLYPAQFGNRLILTPHIYRMNAAAVFTDTLYLDAEANANAVFVMQVAGALTTSTYSKVRLINGAQAKNVYWLVEGAVSISDYSVFCGTIICHNGLIILNTGVVLDGRALTTTGAVNTFAISANNSFGGYCLVLPLELMSFTGACDKQNILLKWSTTVETNSSYFTVERSEEGVNWQAAGTVEGAGSSSFVHAYAFTDRLPGKSISYYRLKQTDLKGNFKYGEIVAVKRCEDDALENIILYPNPSNGQLGLMFRGDRSKVNSIEIFNSLGEKIYEAIGFQPKIDVSRNAPGIYIMYVHLPLKTINRRFEIRK